jgi:hypothetical protein
MELGMIAMADLLNIIRRKTTHYLEQSTWVDDWQEHPSLIIHCTEKQGVEIHRSINVEATTVDQAPGRLLRHGLMS